MAGRRERGDAEPSKRASKPPAKSRRAKRSESQRWVEEADATMRLRAKARAAVRDKRSSKADDS